MSNLKTAVLISCFDWYKARLEPVRELLIDRGYKVIILESDFDHIKKREIEMRYPECTYIHVPKYMKNISLQRIWSHIFFSKQCGRMIGQLKPDLIYCMLPPNMVARYCANYKKRYSKSKLILDIIDLWPESMPLRKAGSFFPLIKWKEMRNSAIRVADHVFTECGLYQEKLKDVIDQGKTSTLYLYKQQTKAERELVEEIIRSRKDDLWTDSIIRFAYLGSMNNIIDIDGICGVIKQFIDSGKSCELHAIGDGESKGKFEESVKRTGCTTYFYGPVFDESEKIRLLAPCDFAFNMMKDDIAVGLTIKSIDYLSYGLPIINNIKGDTWKNVESEGIGYNIDGHTSIFRTLDHRIVEELFSRDFTLRSFTDRVRATIDDLGDET